MTKIDMRLNQTKRRGGYLFLVVLIVGALVWLGRVPSTSAEEPTISWAFTETFDGDPTSPSQDALPRNIDYIVTHRSHPKEQFSKVYDLFPADHADNCAGPDPAVSPLPTHMVRTRQNTNGDDIDQSFFLCKNHMMTAMGDVEWYSVTAFWPKQEFDFSDGGIIEWSVNINEGFENRNWWELMITPRDQMKFHAAPPFPEAANEETYPEDHIVIDFRRQARRIRVGTDQLAPDGWIVDEREWGQWDYRWWNKEDGYPDDPAIMDRRIRRKMRLSLDQNQLIWSIETPDGSFDDFVVDVPGGLPFDQGLVVFKTHAYHPHKDDNYDTYTFHWDNIRFDGPVVGKYDAYYADDVVYLQADGDRPIGDTETVSLNLPSVPANPALFGQLNQPMKGQVLLSINGGPNMEVEPYLYDRPNCISDHWSSFRLDLDPAMLQAGANTLKWTIGPENPCATDEYDWNGFSVKGLQIQIDQAGSAPTAVEYDAIETTAPKKSLTPLLLLTALSLLTIVASPYGVDQH